MCFLPYGHNRSALSLFQRTLAEVFDEAVALVPTALPDSVAKARGFHSCLNYPYSGVVESRFAPLVNHLMKKPTKSRFYVRETLRRLEFAWLLVETLVRTRDALLSSTERNWQKVFDDYGITSLDSIFFPGTDYYGASTLLTHVMQRPEQSPRIHMRMLGVMEHAALWQSRPTSPSVRRFCQKQKSLISMSAVPSRSFLTTAEPLRDVALLSIKKRCPMGGLSSV